jgi:hypothetical protein
MDRSAPAIEVLLHLKISKYEILRLNFKSNKLGTSWGVSDFIYILVNRDYIRRPAMVNYLNFGVSPVTQSICLTSTSSG